MAQISRLDDCAMNNMVYIATSIASILSLIHIFDEKIHGTLAALEQAMKDDDKAHIAPSMCYAYAALDVYKRQ